VRNATEEIDNRIHVFLTVEPEKVKRKRGGSIKGGKPPVQEGFCKENDEEKCGEGELGRQ